MRTVGQIFKETREAKLLTLEDVEKVTKIRKELIAALESGSYAKLPPPTFVQGFIKNYAKYLNLDPVKILAVFRREFADDKYRPYVMDALTKSAPNRKLMITPGRILGLVIAGSVLIFFIYLWTQYHQFVSPPSLTINSPPDQYTTDNPNIVVAGQTNPESKVTLNGQEIPLDINGHFQEQFALTEPQTEIEVVSVAKFGQKVQVKRTVFLKKN